jgi:hypothetical protein
MGMRGDVHVHVVDGWMDGGKGFEGSLWGGGRFLLDRGRLAEYLIEYLSCCSIFDESRGHGRTSYGNLMLRRSSPMAYAT